jgi:transposase
LRCGAGDEFWLKRGFGTQLRRIFYKNSWPRGCPWEPCVLQPHAGQRHDKHGIPLTNDLTGATLLADKGYDSDAFLKKLKKQGVQAVIPPKKNRKIQRAYDRHLYRERHLIECFFEKIKHFRRIFSRFDKTGEAYMGFIHLSSSMILLR